MAGSAEELATDLYNAFRDSDFTKGAVYDISYSIDTISAGGAFGGGSTVTENFSTTAFTVGTQVDNAGVILATDLTVKVLVAEMVVPPLNHEITFDSEDYKLVTYMQDPTKTVWTGILRGS